jgi:hypothetical protein
MTKKIIISLILCFSLIGVSIQSKAVVPVLVALGLIDAGGAITGSGLGLLAAGAMLTPTALQPLVGERMGMFEFGKDNDSNGSIDSSIRIPMTNQTRDRPQANPNLPSSTPIVNAPSVNPVSANTYCSRIIYQGQWSAFSCAGDSISAQIAACGGFPVQGAQCEGGPYNGSNVYVYNETVQSCPSGYTLDNGSCVKDAQTPSCDAGYTLIDGACSLTNPEVVPDGKCDIELSAGAYRAVTGDPDCTSPPQNMRVENGNLLFDAVDPQTNEPVNYAVTPPMSAGGGGSACPYQICIPVPGLPGHYRISAITNASSGGQAVNVDVNGETGIVSQVSSVPLNGQLIREGQVYTNAQGQLVNVQNGQLVLVNATGGTLVQAPTNAVAQPSINVSIPTDYARSGEASTAADKIVNKLDESQDNPDLLAPDLVNPLVSYFNPLRSWSVPSQSGQCPTGSFTWNNNEYNFNVMCQLFNENLTLIQGAMSVFYTILALMIVLGA